MLISVDRYRVITGDSSTAATAVSAAVETAGDLLGEELGWPGGVESAERTETLGVLEGRVYPSAVPITVAAGFTIDGHALRGATPQWADIFEDVDGAPVATVTYTGGWTSATVPASVERDVAWAARALLNPAEALSVPAGATSVRLGDASVSYGRPQSPGTAGVAWSRKTLGWHVKHRRVGTP